MKRKLITKKDLILIVVLALASASLLVFNYCFKNDGETAVISVDGKTVKVLDLSKLDKKTEIELENGVVITAENGTVCFSESDCRDKVCIGTGKISKAGDTAVCVPNKTVITVIGESDSFDTVTY